MENTKKFYIVRNEHSNPEADWLYAMTNTLAEALQLIHDDELQDAAVQFCRGEFPNNYEVYKTLKRTK